MDRRTHALLPSSRRASAKLAWLGALAVVGSALADASTATAQDADAHAAVGRPTLADVRLAISVGEGAPFDTYVVLGDASPGDGPVVSQRLEYDRYATTRDVADARLTDDARAELGERWVVYTAGGERCAGTLGAAVVLELVDAYGGPSGEMLTPGPGGELGVAPYTVVLAAPLVAECGAAARFALPASEAPAMVLATSHRSPRSGERARRLVLGLPIHAELAAEYRRVALEMGVAPEAVDDEIVSTVRAVFDREHGVRGWMVSVAYSFGCGDGVAALWALVLDGPSGPVVRAVGRDFDTPSLVLDLDGDRELEVVHEHGLRRIEEDVLPPLAITRSPPGCPC